MVHLPRPIQLRFRRKVPILAHETLVYTARLKFREKNNFPNCEKIKSNRKLFFTVPVPGICRTLGKMSDHSWIWHTQLNHPSSQLHNIQHSYESNQWSGECSAWAIMLLAFQPSNPYLNHFYGCWAIELILGSTIILIDHHFNRVILFATWQNLSIKFTLWNVFSIILTYPQLYVIEETAPRLYQPKLSSTAPISSSWTISWSRR